MFIYLETHKSLKSFISLFFILMLVLTLFNDFAVTSNAFTITASMGLLIGSMLVSTGIALSGESFSRGIASMYFSASAAVKSFIDTTSKLITAGTAASVAVPVKLLLDFKKTTTKVFDPGKTTTPDVSGSSATVPEILNSPNLTSFQSSKYVGLAVRDMPHSGAYNFPVYINTMSADSPNKAIAVPILEKQGLNLSSGNAHESFNATGTNCVQRFSTFSGLTFDYSVHVSGVKDNPKKCLVEVSENGKCVGSEIFEYDSFNWTIPDYTVSMYSSNCYQIQPAGARVGYNKGYVSFPVSFDPSCINSGICDRTTGVLPVPSISYLPDVGGICNDGVWDKAAGGILSKNPDASIDVNIPSSTDALTNAKWDTILAQQAELTKALIDALANIGNPPAVPDVDIGDVGVSTITGANNNFKKLDDFFLSIKPDLSGAMNGIDPSTVTIPGSISSSILWINQQFFKCFNSLGDFKFIVLFPMFIGILLLLIGRGSQVALSTQMKSSTKTKSLRPVPLPKLKVSGTPSIPSKVKHN